MHVATHESFEMTRDPLAGIPSLGCRVAIYVPTTIHDEPAEANVVRFNREKVAEALSRYFGGYTEVAGTGGWYSESLGKVIREPVWIVYAGADRKALDRCLPSLVRLAGSIAGAMSQECVTLEVEGRMYFVPASAVPVVEPESVAV